MKSTPLFLLSIALLLVLAACGGNSGNGGNAADSGKEISVSSAAAQEEIVIKATNFSFDKKEYHLKKGVPVKIVFENESGNHGVLVPELNLQLDGKNNSQVIVPEQTGTFRMTCAIFCGSGHSQMSADIIVE
ncbi:cytochrome c oxidase subunit 2 [Paenibacillus sophorae]|uniref:Cupredoxin domain-containing protein n=1 Tax=Paenibacillus sophorae TaxID=1333845 RepID=A0A1H8MB49_9BACL|nr:cupredoxin domain-containing protein [Paenibacillus sophorae]QWU17742.1 cupredoxin domain-containing protein [Paenibacillus sophorae]SEO14523.1 cytochrome c oxidase subunit 2 [Paenibacillus sophorae]